MRYRILETKDVTLLLKDDGYRIAFLILSPEAARGTPHHEWEPWAEYKQCNLPGPAALIAELLMGKAEKSGS